MKPEHKEYILDNIDKMSVKRISRNLNIKEKRVWEFLEHEKKKGQEPAPPTASPTAPPKRVERVAQKKPVVLSVILIVLLGFAVYGNSLTGEFIWDDVFLIERNTYIRDASYIPKIFSEDLGAGAGKEYNFYRPVQLITYMADYSLWKLDVRGYHLTNILLHICVALSLYYLINAIFKDNLLALLTGSFFVVHPIHTEVVTYLSGRADSLALLFMLLCALCYIKSSSSNGIGVYILISLSCALALLSRENSLILPVLLLVYHYSFKKKIEIKKFLIIPSLAVIYILLRLTVLKALLTADAADHMTSLLPRLPGVFVALSSYIKLLFLPFPLHMEYGTKMFAPGDPRVILGIVILIALLFFSFKRKENATYISFCALWFLVAFLPVSNLFPINAYMAEHWMYLPSIGFFLIVAKTISVGATGRPPAGKAGPPLLKTLTIIFAICLLAFYSYLTIRQNNFWKEPISFYERTLRYAPDSSGVNFNLGIAYTQINQEEKAIASYKRAIESKTDYAEAHNNLGIVYATSKRYDEAAASFKKAIEIKKDFADAYNNLGNIYRDAGKNEEAIALYQKAIAAKPNHEEAYNNLGVLYADIDKTEEAIALYKKAIGLNAHYAAPHNNLGHLYLKMNKKNEAAASYKKAVEINPDSTEARNNLSRVYAAFNKNEGNIASYKKLLKINPNYAEAHHNLGIAYAAINNIEEAIASYKKAIEFKDDYVEAYYNLGNIYARLKRTVEAVSAYKKAIEHKADFAKAYLNLGNVYKTSGDRTAAMASYKKAVDLDPSYALAHNHLATTYFQEKDYQAAITHCEKAKNLGFTNAALIEALKPYRKKGQVVK